MGRDTGLEIASEFASEFAIGQRWVSHTEPDLGLGIIADVDGRLVHISFPASGEQRTYAMDNAPIARIQFKAGDTIRTRDEETLTVVDTALLEGRLVYQCLDATGNTQQVDELDLDSYVELSSPKQRLVSGQLDDPKAYELRCETLEHLSRLQESRARGLMGTRNDFLEHQIYIAYTVARRFAPRVLLADEVGLGKTIEAGMILHYQVQTGLASRVLILVPNSLVHQWLVEMMRRFNLRFSLFTEERVAEPGGEGLNPFETEQLILCDQNLVTRDEQLFQQALAADWDMLIVDEAHHLHWSADQRSAQDDVHARDYQCVEALAAKSKGVLLLTATPEQAGIESHFARLRLLDPARFHDLEAFRGESQRYRALNQVMDRLQASQVVDEQSHATLVAFMGDTAPPPGELSPQALESLIETLLDYHGTGRVFLRNTRAAIKGFPRRVLHEYALESPAHYVNAVGLAGLYPEQSEEEGWVQSDPRVTWLVEFVRRHRSTKVLVICAHAETAIALEQFLHLRVGIRSAAFYEDLSIIERDRAAAYFSDMDAGAQVLVCSEIGSEGRNFQFAHHLVLFDLPMNPDLLEQRIGRLDRIGQRHDVNLHVPFFEGSAQEVMLQWYRDGLGIFAESFAAAYTVFEEFEEPLLAALDSPAADHQGLLKAVQARTLSLKESMRKGRDKLIELNSCNPTVARQVIDTILSEEKPQQLSEYFGRMLDVYGVDHEDHSEDTWVLHPTDHMRTQYFPGLSDESCTVTFSREVAVVREDMEFLSWEHPMLAEAMSMTLDSELGNASLVSLGLKGVQEGTLLLEILFGIHYAAPKALRVDRYLPVSPVRVLIDRNGKILSSVLSHAKLNELCQRVRKSTAQAIIKQARDDIESMLNKAKGLPATLLGERLSEAGTRADQEIGAEIARLAALRERNPSIRSEEVQYLRDQLKETRIVMDNARYEIEALRLVVVTPSRGR